MSVPEMLSSYWQRLLVYGYYTAKPHGVNPISFLRQRHEQQARSVISRRYPQLFACLSTLIERTSSTGCEFSDYLKLYELLRIRKPQYMLELGSGISSCVFAYAAKEYFAETGIKPVVVSMEESWFYHQQIRRIFPGDLLSFVDFRYAQRQEKMYGSYRGCYYAEIPVYPYQFIFIDGPTTRAHAGAPKCFNADFINIIQKSDASIYGIIDQRIGTYLVLKKMMPGARIRYHPVWKLATIEGASKRIVLW